MILFRRICAGLLLSMGLGIMCLAASGLAQGQEKKDQPKAVTGRVDWTGKLIEFEMRDKAWRDVFQWLADQTGLPYASNYKPPTSTFTFINSKDPKTGQLRKYTLLETYDIINEMLQVTTKHTLVRRDNIITMFPADDPIPDEFVPRIGLAELPDRARTDVVEIVVRLKGQQNADEFAPEVKRMLGPFGRVTPLSISNQLILRAPVSTLRRELPNIIPEEDPSVMHHTHTCKFIPAARMAGILRESLGQSRQIIEVKGGGKDGGDGKDGGGGFKGFPGGGGGGGATRRLVEHTITFDAITNKVSIHGPPSKVEQAKKVIRDFDTGEVPLAIGPLELKFHDMRSGGAENMQKVLKEVFKDDPNVNIQVILPTRLSVYGNPQSQIIVAKIIANEDKPVVQEMRLVNLQQLDAVKFVEMLQKMFPDSKNGAPFIDADTDKNAIRIRGTKEQMKEVEEAIRIFDGNPIGVKGGYQMIILEKGSGATLTEALYLLFPKFADNPVQKILPGNLELSPDFSLKDKKEGKEPKFEDLPGLTPKKTIKKSVSRVTPLDLRLAMHISREEEVAFAAQDVPSKKPDPKKPPLVIMGFGNRIVIQSEDPAALSYARDIIRILTKTEADVGDIEVIGLKYANAVEVSKILDEAFNGKAQGGGRGGPGGGGGGGLGGLPGMMLSIAGIGGGGGGGRSENIRIVADPATNSLLVRAKPIDMLTIRRLILQKFDVRNIDSDQIVKTHPPVKLEFANAQHVSDILKQVYAEAMTPKQGQGGGGGFPFGGGGFGGARSDASGLERRVLMTVGVDVDTNTLHISCPTILFDDVKTLVKNIDDATGKTEQKAIVLNKVDPALVQQAMDAVSGRTTTGSRPGLFGDTGSGGLGAFNSQRMGGFPAIGFPGGGGGGGNFFFPGGGGGGPGTGPGGGGGFKGGFPGGGGGFKGGGKGGNQSRGPDFFGPSVTDDRSLTATAFYDPSEEQEEPRARKLLNGFEPLPFYSVNPLQVGLVQEPMPQPEKNGKDGKESKDGEIITLPRVVPKVIVVGDRAILIGNEKDLLVWQRFFQDASIGSNIEVEVVPVRLGDPTSIVHTLNELYATVNLGPTSTTLVPRTGIAGPGVPAPTPQPATTPGLPGQPPTPTTPTTTAQQFLPRNMVLIPLPRLGAILVAAQRARMKDIREQIHKLDQLPSDVHGVVQFQLERAPASRVAAELNAFYQSRFPKEGVPQNQIRISANDTTNTVFVQASQADLVDIRNMIMHIDRQYSKALTELRVIPLKNAVAIDLAAVLRASIGQGTLTTSSTLGIAPATATVTPGGATSITGGANQIANTKFSTVRFRSNLGKGELQTDANILEDIRINWDDRTNALIISAPEKTMPMVLAVIRDLDVPPKARSEINIFQLKKTDATQVALALQQLFLGAGGLGARAGAGTPATPNLATFGPGGGGAGATQQRPLTITIQNTTPEGAPIIDLRVTVVDPTNSLIVAGSRNDLDVVEAIIDRIEGSNFYERRYEAVRLRNQNAADVATAVTNFLTASLNIDKTNYPGVYLELQREVIVVAEPISNSLLISATPTYFEKVIRMVSNLDTTPPQVVVSVLIAEVTMSGSEEFGIELGLQSPILFDRGIGATGASVLTATSATPGFPFNSVAALGNNPNASTSGGDAGKGVVGFQGINNLGVGRASATNGVGGFVFSAASNSVSVLVRALKVQNRLTVLSRPTIMTLDNQAALINIGASVPYISSTTVTATGLVTPSFGRQNTGVNMQVTPKITPDGRVLLRVIPEVISLSPSTVDLGNGIKGTIFNTQHIETSVAVADGETIMLGGLISKRDEKNENKIPWLGDLPVVGAAFRYRTYSKSKTELIFIMTPHIVRNRFEAEQILREETRRIDWSIGDINRMHGTANCGPIMHEVMPEPQSKIQPYRIVPGQPNAGQTVQPMETRPQPAPGQIISQSEPTSRGGLLKNINLSSTPLPERFPAPLVQSGDREPIFKGGLLRNVVTRRPQETVISEGPANVTYTPMPSGGQQATVSYAPMPAGPQQAGALPELIVPAANEMRR